MMRSIIPLFIPHLGCPNDCSFCNQVKISGKKKNFRIEDLENEVERYSSYFEDREGPIEIAFYGGSFTALDKETFKSLCDFGKRMIDEGKAQSLRCSTRPDAISKEILQRMKKSGFTTIELGAQSTNEKVLKINNRGHSVENLEKSSKEIKEAGFQLGLQMMTGLYQSNSEIDFQTALDFVRLEADFVRIYPTIIVKDTLLEKLYQLGEYIPETLEEAVNSCVKISRLFEENEIPIIRMGLQSDENFIEEGIVAGPYHSAFRSLVEEKKMLEKLMRHLEEFRGVEKLEISSPGKVQSYIIGQKGKNRDFIKEYFNIKKLSFSLGEEIVLKTNDKHLNLGGDLTEVKKY